VRQKNLVAESFDLVGCLQPIKTILVFAFLDSTSFH